MPRKISSILIIILILVLILFVFRHALCQLLIERLTARATGLELSIEQLNLDILSSTLLIKNLVLFNPPGFENKILGRAEQILIQYHPLALLSGQIHLRLVRLNISEINIIRNEQGQSNVARFKPSKSKAQAAKKPVSVIAQTEERSVQDTKKEKPKQKRPKFLIDRLELAPTKATYTNYSARAEEPAVIIFTVKGPSVFTNISDLRAVVNSVSSKGGFKAILDHLLGVFPQDILKNSSDALKKKLGEIIPQTEAGN